MAIFKREKDKEEAKKCVWGNVLARRGTIPASEDANCPLSQVQGAAQGGKGHHAGDEPRKSWQGREAERRQKTGMTWFRGLWRR